MTDRFESILDESISALQAGVSLDDILAEVPEYADQLRPLLFASSLLADPNPRLVPEQKKADLRAEYLRQVADLPVLPVPTVSQKSQAIYRIIKRRLTREAVINDLVTIVITLAVTLSLMALILNVLAVESIPGDLLYPIKRTSESVRLNLTFDAPGRANLADQFNQRRLYEIEQLVAQNRAALVEFNGLLESKGDNLWVIEGYTIFLPDDVRLDPALQEGDRVQVVGFLRTNNVLVADTITAWP
jgi:hypothetical protein